MVKICVRFYFNYLFDFRKLSLRSKLSKSESSEGLQGKNLSLRSTNVLPLVMSIVYNSFNFFNSFNFDQVEFPKLVLFIFAPLKRAN